MVAIRVGTKTEVSDPAIPGGPNDIEKFTKVHGMKHLEVSDAVEE